MDSVTFTDPIIAALSESIVFSKQYGKIDTAFAKAYGVVAYPTMVLVKANGSELDRIVGFRPPVKLIPELFDIIRNRNTLDDYLTGLAAYPDSFELRQTVAEKYRYRGEDDLARRHYLYALEKDPENANGFSDDALFALGKMDARDKDHAAAIERFELLLADYPESELNEEVSLWIPYTYMQADDTATAIRLFEAFIEEFPESEELDWVKKQVDKLKGESEGSR